MFRNLHKGFHRPGTWVLGLALLCACGKTFTVEEPRELTLRPAATVSTKADPELNGASLGTDNSYVILASASAAEQPEYLTGQWFTYHAATAKWKATTVDDIADSGTYDYSHPVFWPMGGVMVDFLALALKPEAYGVLTTSPGSITFNDAGNGGSAGGVTIAEWNTYENQYDVMYAVNNGQSVGNSSAGTVPLNFQHALAVVSFTAKNTSGDDGIFTLKSLTMNGLYYKGTLTLDNTTTGFSPSWAVSDDDGHQGDKDIPMTSVPFVVPGPSASGQAIKCTEHLLVIPQVSRSVTLTYRVSNSPADLTLVLPLPRQVWRAGHRYTYNLGLNATEIKAEVLDVSVSAWDGSHVDESITVD